MHYPKDIYDNIDAFVKENLQGAELQEFEAALLQNTELREKVENARSIQKLVFQHRLLSVKDLAKKEEARIENKNLFIKKVTIGAVFLIMILATIGILQYNKKGNTDVKQAIENHDNVQITTVEGASEKSDSEKKPDQKLTKDDSVNSKILKSNNTAIPHSESNFSKADTIQPEIPGDNTFIKPEVYSIENSENISGSDTKLRDENTQPCDLVHLKAEISSTPACIGSADGKIEAVNITGGTMPYTQTLFTNGKEVYSNSGLKTGKYEL